MVSVIIPTHNRCEMLQKAIDSTLAQQGVEVDIIVVDDVSTDATEKIMSGYKNIKYIQNKDNLGPGKTRQKGYLAAKGKYIVFLDDDDYYTDFHFYKKAVDLMERNPYLAFVSGNVQNYEVANKKIKNTNIGLEGYINGKDYFINFMIKFKKPTSTFPTVFRKNILDQADFKNMEMMNDSSIYLRALLYGDAYILNDIVGVYTIHKSNISKTISLPFLYENLEEKKRILKHPLCQISNKKNWWFNHYKLTYRYFVKSRHRIAQETSLLYWGIKNTEGSFRMFIFIIRKFLILILHYIKSFVKKAIGYSKYFFRPWIMLDGYVKFKDGDIIHNNFGDDINIPLLKALTGKDVFHISQSKLGRVTRLLCIGSIIEDFCSENYIIWGSGCMYGNKKIKYKPKKVYAVRGKLSRQVLLEQGIPCPEIYGDPALLLPYIYTPHTKKKYKYGVIPHVLDYDLPHVKEFRENHPEILFIKIKNYKSWQDVIEQINSCEIIISSSLHGLIISDAYGIPNVRVVFSDRIGGGDFKFKDYFSGIGREYIDPIDFRKIICLDAIIRIFQTYKSIKYNPQVLLKAFPYKLLPQFQKIAENKDVI